MELREALVQIAAIRCQLERARVYRGFRSVPVAVSAALAIVGAALQPVLVPMPAVQLDRYLGLWFAVAGLSLAATAVEIVIRYRRDTTLTFRESTLLTLEAFLPCLLAGGAITAFIAAAEPGNARLLPGLWQTLFALGLFAARPQLPRPLVWPAGWYLASGLVSLILSRGDLSLSPWLMGVAFGLGQGLTAFILWWTLERPDAEAADHD